jgi:hypothetical protein
LFERRGNSILLYPAGQLLYRKLPVAKQLHQELSQEMRSVSVQFFQKVRMAGEQKTTIPIKSLSASQNGSIPKANSLFLNIISFSPNLCLFAGNNHTKGLADHPESCKSVQ